MGILEEALAEKKREDFIRYKLTKGNINSQEAEDMVSYILSSQCEDDLNKLICREYTMPAPLHFRIPKNFSGRKRDIYTWRGSVKYLFKLIAFCLRDYDYLYSDGLYSFRTSVSAHDFLLKLRQSENINDYYIVKTDVSDYVKSIVPELIIPQLEKMWQQDPSFLDLMKYLLLRRECTERDGSVVACEPGGLGGIPLGNHFMNVYLMDMDDYFYPRSPLYCRYSDDIIIFARDLQESREYLACLNEFLKEHRLSTNSEKTCILEPGGEVSILGCKLADGKMDVADQSKEKIKRKIRMRANHLVREKKEKGLSDEECGKLMVQYCNVLFFGKKDANKDMTWARWLFPVITTTSSLAELDHYAQDAIRYVMCGSFAEKRYRVTYDRLKELGYRSLVHAYYHYEIQP